jgi:hypothetical protein
MLNFELSLKSPIYGIKFQNSARVNNFFSLKPQNIFFKVTNPSTLPPFVPYLTQTQAKNPLTHLIYG